MEDNDDHVYSRTSRGGRIELLVGVVVAGILITLAVPIFLQQREKAGEVARTRLSLNILQAADTYRRIGRVSGTYPEAGVYTRENPILNVRGRPAFRPSETITITTEITPENEFVIKGRSTTLAGTFSSRYDSTRAGSSAPTSRNDRPVL